MQTKAQTQSTVRAKCGEITFTDADVINYDDFIPAGEFNPHNVRPWLLHNHGFVVAIVFASCLQDALDEACDAGKLDRYLIDEPSNTPGTKGLDARDYPSLGTLDEEGITRLGNASEPFDIESLSIVEMSNPPASFAAQWNAVND